MKSLSKKLHLSNQTIHLIEALRTNMRISMSKVINGLVFKHMKDIESGKTTIEELIDFLASEYNKEV